MAQNTKSGGGTTLIDGTAYQINFEKTIQVSVSGGYINNTIVAHIQGYAEINGQKIADGTVEINPGDKVRVYVTALNSRYGRDSIISVNGTIVSDQDKPASSKEYVFYPQTDAIIEFYEMYDGADSVAFSASILI